VFGLILQSTASTICSGGNSFELLPHQTTFWVAKNGPRKAKIFPCFNSREIADYE